MARAVVASPPSLLVRRAAPLPSERDEKTMSRRVVASPPLLLLLEGEFDAAANPRIIVLLEGTGVVMKLLLRLEGLDDRPLMRRLLLRV
jgi:hypothetical protein